MTPEQILMDDIYVLLVRTMPSGDLDRLMSRLAFRLAGNELVLNQEKIARALVERFSPGAVGEGGRGHDD